MTTTIPFLSRSDAEACADWISALSAAMPGVVIREFGALSLAERAAARVAIVANPEPSEISQLPNLVWMQSLWAGVERLVAELPANAPAIVRMTDPQLAQTMAEAVLAWTLYLHRDMPRYHRQQDRREWRQHPLPLPSERRIGLLGLGELGRAAAQRLIQQGFRLAGWSRFGADVSGVESYAGTAGLASMLSTTDILVILLPLTVETRGLIGASALATLPRGASLINFARGPIVEEKALIAALDAGHLDHAVLDVFDQEPLPPEHAYWRHPAITVLPHISAPTNLTTASAIAARNIIAFLTDGVVPPKVDRVRGY